jgi:hypothetical protein
LIHFYVEREGDVVAQEFEVGVALEVGNVVSGAGVEVVDAEDFVTLSDEVFAEVGAEEPGATGD